MDYLPSKVLDKNRLQTQYKMYYPHLRALLYNIETYLHTIIPDTIQPSYKMRVKQFESYYRKLIRLFPKNTDAFPILTDLIGLRIICPFLQNLDEIETVLKTNLSVIEIERKGSDQSVKEFGYESTHILAHIPKKLKEGLDIPPNLRFEIQIRTLLQDAWAEVEHELVYKSDFSPFDLRLKRKLSSVNACLSLADIIFQEVKEYQTKLNTAMDTRRNRFYAQANELLFTILPECKDSKSPVSYSSQNFCALETIDELILQAIKAHNDGDFDTAESLYTTILTHKPNTVVASIVFKHRGMAYFAQGNYQQAYNDFNASVSANPDNFRAYYYAGIALMLMNRYTEAIALFTKSLNINKHQPYAYFRRALAYFQEQQMLMALRDLDYASKLGLNSEDEKKLRAAIAKKIDIV